MALTWLLYRFRPNLSRAFRNSLFPLICPEAAGKIPVNPAPKPPHIPLIPAFLAKMTKNFAAAGGEGAKISIDKPPEILYLKAQRNMCKRDDREKILSRHASESRRMLRGGAEGRNVTGPRAAPLRSVFRFRRGRPASLLAEALLEAVRAVGQPAAKPGWYRVLIDTPLTRRSRGRFLVP